MMMIEQRIQFETPHRKGVALLVVLLIVMVITILSLGFLSRSDVELACGQNMILKTQMDYTAESGLEQAKGLILNPQDIDTTCWDGGDSWTAADQQLAAGQDYYDVSVKRDDTVAGDYCNYIIDCNSYRLSGGEQTGRSSLSAQLRIDPAVCCWVGTGTTISERVTINGDVYCAGSLWNGGDINGDIYADGTISGTAALGGEYESVSEEPVTWPDVQVNDLSGTYYIGTAGYSVDYVSSLAGSYVPSSGNPAGILYRSTLGMTGNVNIEGTLVTNSLQVSGTNNVITATKNFPALVVNGDLKMYSGSLVVNGLAIVGGEVLIGSSNASLTVTGGLYVQKGISELAIDNSGNFILAKMHYSPTWRPTGGSSFGALEFDGVNDYAQTDDSSTKLQLTGDYTLSVWVKPNTYQKQWAGIISKCSPDGSTNHWTLQFDSSSSRQLVIYHPSGSWNTGITLNNLTSDGLWHHVAVVRDDSSNMMTSYLDDVVKNSGTFNYSPGSGNGHLNIGCDRTASSGYVYSGRIDEIRIYNQALDPNEMGGTSGLIGLFKLNDTGSNISITANPITSAIRIWPEPGQAVKWSPAGGAFYRSIERR